MIDNVRVLGVIPARGGSKGIKRKNVRDLAGKPLIAWTIEAALLSKYIDRVIVSTDDSEIAQVSAAYGAEVPFTRPSVLASDTASSVALLEHAIKECPGYGFVVLLQPTSPLRKTSDIDACIELCAKGSTNSVVSVKEVDTHPAYIFRETNSRRLEPLLPEMKGLRRQDLPRLLALNGAVYVVATQWFLRAKSLVAEESQYHVMPRERSIDIDEEFDLVVARHLIG